MGGRLLLLALSLAVALALAEVAARILDPEWRLFYPPVCFRPDLFEATLWGYRLHPSRTLRHRYPRGSPREFLLASNAEGFRGRRDLGAPDPRPRVVVLGDSMVFGEGVAEEDRLTEQLEAAEPGWRVDNLGMIGYGPDLMLRALEAVALEPRPTAALLAIYSDDLRRLAPLYAGVGFPIPRYVLADGQLVTVPYPRPRPWEYSRLVQGLLYVRWRYGGVAFPLATAILDRYLEVARGHGIQPALAFVPRAEDRFDDARRRRWLAAYAAEHAAPYLDLTATLHVPAAERLYLPHDPHWSAEGHRAVAAALDGFVAAVLAAPRVDSGHAFGYGPEP